MTDKLKVAKKAINDLFSDTSVSPVETLEMLKELLEELDLLIAAIEDDLDN